MTTLYSFRPWRTMRAGSSHSTSPLAVRNSIVASASARASSTSPLMVLKRCSFRGSSCPSIWMSPLTVWSSVERSLVAAVVTSPLTVLPSRCPTYRRQSRRPRNVTEPHVARDRLDLERSAGSLDGKLAAHGLCVDGALGRYGDVEIDTEA